MTTPPTVWWSNHRGAFGYRITKPGPPEEATVEVLYRNPDARRVELPRVIVSGLYKDLRSLGLQAIKIIDGNRAA